MSAEQEIETYGRRFRALYTGFVVDALGKAGREVRILPPEIAPLDRRMRLAGPAFTIEGRLNPDAPRKATIEGILTTLGSVPFEHVAVYQTNDDVFAHFGEMAATALLARRCVGVVSDGGCRTSRGCSISSCRFSAAERSLRTPSAAGK